MTTVTKTRSLNSSDEKMNFINPTAVDDGDRAMLYAVSAGHFIVDMCQGTVPVMLPFLLTRMHLSYAQAGLVVTAAYLTSSVTQPLFGLIKVPLVQRFAMPVGVLLACLFL